MSEDEFTNQQSRTRAPWLRGRRPRDKVSVVLGVVIRKNMSERLRPIQSILGPCSIYSYEQLSSTVSALNRGRVPDLVSNRAPLEKPRTGDEWTGLKREGVPIIQTVKQETGCRIAMEATIPPSLEYMLQVADDLWLGSRQNPTNTMALADALRGVKLGMFLVKNPYAPDEKAWVGAIEVIKNRLHSSVKVVALFRGFCERTRAPGAELWRNNPDIELVKRVVNATGVDAWIDWSHLIGDANLLIQYLTTHPLNPIWQGIMLEVDAQPENARTDKKQVLLPQQAIKIINSLRNQNSVGFGLGII